MFLGSRPSEITHLILVGRVRVRKGTPQDITAKLNGADGSEGAAISPTKHSPDGSRPPHCVVRKSGDQLDCSVDTLPGSIRAGSHVIAGSFRDETTFGLCFVTHACADIAASRAQLNATLTYRAQRAMLERQQRHRPRAGRN